MTFKQVSQMLPEQIVNAWNSAYPNGNWAIRSIRGEGDFAKCVFIDDPMPAWFNIIKFYPMILLKKLTKRCFNYHRTMMVMHYNIVLKIHDDA